MVRSKLIIVSDDQDVVQRAKAFAVSNGVSCEVYSAMEWDNKTGGNMPLTSGTQPVEMGAKILPFPGSGSFSSSKKVQTINELESVAIEKAISEYNGNLTEAAKALGIGRATLYRKVKQYGLDPSQARKKRAA
ncbi:MAG: hypothetical protein H6625_07025 [Bdellovibrionaceae bacterium]|nr:hypothetical protein [Pseudobdellovibrionaceae bacterium]